MTPEQRKAMYAKVIIRYMPKENFIDAFDKRQGTSIFAVRGKDYDKYRTGTNSINKNMVIDSIKKSRFAMNILNKDVTHKNWKENKMVHHS